LEPKFQAKSQRNPEGKSQAGDKEAAKNRGKPSSRVFRGDHQTRVQRRKEVPKIRSLIEQGKLPRTKRSWAR